MKKKTLPKLPAPVLSVDPRPRLRVRTGVKAGAESGATARRERTQKSPSDFDEMVTMKYPSDSDEWMGDW